MAIRSDLMKNNDKLAIRVAENTTNQIGTLYYQISQLQLQIEDLNEQKKNLIQKIEELKTQNKLLQKGAEQSNGSTRLNTGNGQKNK